MSEKSPKHGLSGNGPDSLISDHDFQHDQDIEEEKKLGKLSQDEERVKDMCEKLDSIIRHADEIMEVIEANPLIKKDGFDFEVNRMMIHGWSEVAKSAKEIIQHLENPKGPFVSKTLLGKVIYDSASKSSTKEPSVEHSNLSFEDFYRNAIETLDDLFARMKVVSKF